LNRAAVAAVFSLTCFLFLTLVSSSSAQNLLTNPGFATDTSGWTLGVSFMTASWENLDATGQSGSGSVLETSTVAGLTNGLTQCVPVVAGQAYDFGARIMAPGGESNQFDANAEVVWYSGSSCRSTSLGTDDGAFVSGTSSVFVGTSASGKVAPAGAGSASLILALGVAPGASLPVSVSFDDAYFQPSGGCTPTATNLCLSNGRFKVEGTWSTDPLTGGQAQTVGLTSDTGYFWFFGPTNVELVIKVIDGCPVNHNFWVFAGGLTNVTTQLVVTDTLTGEQAIYKTTGGPAFAPIQDTAAFATCPQ
jgi:hypothetical protein